MSLPDEPFSLIAAKVFDYRPPKRVESKSTDAPDGETIQQRQKLVANTLAEIIADGTTLFTPALITTRGGLDRDPVVEFSRTMTTFDPAELPFTIDSEFKFFDGFTPTQLDGVLVNWANRLYGITEQHWPQLRDTITSMAWFDSAKATYGQVGLHELIMVDPHALSRGYVGDDLPTIRIYVFCVLTETGLYYLSPATDPPRTRPTVTMAPPNPELLLVAVPPHETMRRKPSNPG